MSDFADRKVEIDIHVPGEALSYPIPVDQVIDFAPPPAEADAPKWKFRATCCVCGQPIEEGRATPRGLIPMGHPYPKPNGTIGLQCEGCYQKHEAHKAE